MGKIDLRLGSGVRVQGVSDPEFGGGLEAFQANSDVRGEVGAAVCVYDRGLKVVDLWGGVADPDTRAPRTDVFFFNSDIWRRGLFPSGNGHGNPRAVARIYAALSVGGSVDGVRVLGSELLERLSTPVWPGICGMTGRDSSYGLGFIVNQTEPHILGDNQRAFGHPGLGVALGWADPDRRRSSAFSPNRLCEESSIGERCEALVAAASGAGA
jgi:CubicO group peptidase (beta-lactamase class C family)